MTYMMLHKGRAATLLGDEAVIKAADAPALRRAVDVLAAADAQLVAAERDAAAIVESARAAGFEEGRVTGEAAAADTVRARLFDLAVKAAALKAEQRAEAAKLAIEIVRRIAGDLGPDVMVPALAERAAADLAPDARATVKVPVAAHASVAERLAANPALTVVADPALGDDDCIVETSFGVVRAGLDTQLTSIERAWARDGTDG